MNLSQLKSGDFHKKKCTFRKCTLVLIFCVVCLDTAKMNWSHKTTEDGSSMTTFYYYPVNHQSGLQRNAPSKLSHIFLIHEYLGLIHPDPAFLNLQLTGGLGGGVGIGSESDDRRGPGPAKPPPLWATSATRGSSAPGCSTTSASSGPGSVQGAMRISMITKHIA